MKVITKSKQVNAFIVALLLIIPSISPAVISAQEAPSTQVETPTTTETSTPPKPATGPVKPNGAEAQSYVYNPSTGNYENGLYSWNPNTGKTTPLKASGYSYDPESNQWNTENQKYDAATGKYEKVEQKPLQSSNTKPKSNAQQENAQATNSPQATNTSNTGPNSNTSTSSDRSIDVDYDITNNAVINNNIVSNAVTGNAVGTKNTSIKNALSGNATGEANVLNLLQSSWNDTGEILTFRADIEGDVYGDLIVNPGNANTGPNSKLSVQDSSDRNLTVNVENNAEINNNIKVAALSGDAELSSNTEAGDAISGNAEAMVNVVNTINSAINTGSSFIGSINISGNLEGDILFPDNFLDQVIQSSGPDSVINLSDEEKAEVLLNIDENVAITNNINSSAESGSVLSDSNTKSGSALSGNAATDVTIVNLTGKKVNATNALLVFVNVGGNWLGLIMDSPTQASSALIGGNVGPDSEIEVAKVEDTTITANLENNFTINNNIDVSAKSGDVRGVGNTSVGNLISGDANTNVNIANITDSVFDLTGWMGVLYVNIGGDWLGSLGVNTAYGNAPTGSDNNSTTDSPGNENATNAETFTFVPRAEPTSSNTSVSLASTNAQSSNRGFSGTNSNETTLVAGANTTATTSNIAQALGETNSAVAAVQAEPNSNATRTILTTLVFAAVAFVLMTLSGRTFRTAKNFLF